MRKKIVITLLIVVFWGGILIYQFGTFMELDNRKIFNETRKAYETVQYEKDLFGKKKEIKNLIEFLLRHVDEIKNYNRHEEDRAIQLTSESWTSHYTNKDDCFIMPTFHPAFVKEYISPELADSLLHYLGDLKYAPRWHKCFFLIQIRL